MGGFALVHALNEIQDILYTLSFFYKNSSSSTLIDSMQIPLFSVYPS